MYLAIVNEHIKEYSKASVAESYSEKFEEFLAVFDEKEDALIWFNGYLKVLGKESEGKTIKHSYQLYEVGNPVPVEIKTVVESVEKKVVVERIDV